MKVSLDNYMDVIGNNIIADDDDNENDMDMYNPDFDKKLDYDSKCLADEYIGL